jgi:hypothetical protein
LRAGGLAFGEQPLAQRSVDMRLKPDETAKDADGSFAGARIAARFLKIAAAD